MFLGAIDASMNPGIAAMEQLGYGPTAAVAPVVTAAPVGQEVNTPIPVVVLKGGEAVSTLPKCAVYQVLVSAPDGGANCQTNFASLVSLPANILGLKHTDMIDQVPFIGAGIWAGLAFGLYMLTKRGRA